MDFEAAVVEVKVVAPLPVMVTASSAVPLKLTVELPEASIERFFTVLLLVTPLLTTVTALPVGVPSTASDTDARAAPSTLNVVLPRGPSLFRPIEVAAAVGLQDVLAEHVAVTALRALKVGQKIAQQNGNNLSKFILDFKRKSPKTKIRLMGHSLGAQVILSTIDRLARYSDTDGIIESVHIFGASIFADSANPRKYGRKMQKIVSKKIVNYYSPSDDVLREAHEDGSVKNPIGFCGALGKTISKYSQKKVFPKNHRFVSYAAVLRSYP